MDTAAGEYLFWLPGQACYSPEANDQWSIMNIGEGSLEASNDNVLNEAEQLIWALLDEEIGAADLKRLEGLISDNNEVRTRYFHCVQLHSDLAEQFGGATTGNDAAVPTSPVLKGLGDTGSTASCRPPVAD